MQAQPTQTTGRTGRSATQWGLIFGGIIAVVAIISGGVSLAGLPGAIGFIFTIIDLALLFLAGFFAARDTGRVGRGAIAGLIAGVIGYAVGSVISVVIILTQPLPQSALNQFQSSGISASQAHTIYVVTGTIVAALGILLGLGLGAGLGALGGLAGRGRAQLPQQTYQETFYQGNSAMGQQGTVPPPPPHMPPPIFPPPVPPQ